jgi:branched-chain amino acid aminotransferase
MPLYPVHKYFFHGSKIKLVSEFIPSENEGGIYEVIRIVNGIPLFLDEHLQRFQYSAKLARKRVDFSENKVEEIIDQLVDVNKIYEGNILLSYKTILKVFFIPHQYPSQQMYQNGVQCGILQAERKNPNAKVFQTNVRELANKLIEKKDFYEVLLMDKLGRITEGSRSNVFFVKNNTLITPPGNEVLLGITRQKTIELASQLNIPFKEEDVYFVQLNDYDALAVTGTSPKILLVNKIEQNRFNVQNRIIRSLMEAYDKLIRDYISEQKKL